MRDKTKGGVCVFEDKRNGKWRVQVTGADRKRTSHTCATKTLAEEIAESARAQRASTIKTVAEAIDMWIAELKDRDTSPGYWVTERTKMAAMFPAATAQLLDELHPVVAQRLYDDLRTRAAVDTHRNALIGARSMCKWLVRKGHMTSNPFADVEGKGRRSKGKVQLTRDEAAKFMDYCLGDPHIHTTAALCCLVLGMRAGEIIGLTPRALDADGTVIRIERHTTKSDSGERLLQVPDCLRDRLPALCSATLNNTQLYRRVQMLCKRAGVVVTGPHGLRGTHASLARLAGATSHLVSSALGHGSTGITEAHYTQASATRQAGATVALQVLEGGRSARESARSTRIEASEEAKDERLPDVASPAQTG